MQLKRLMNALITPHRFSKNVSTSTALKSAYESDGKTSVTVLNKEPGYGIMINSYSKIGFRLSNGMFVVGPMVLFPHTALSWNVTGDQDISRKSLAILGIIEPKLDILVVGYGKRSTISRELNKELLALKLEFKLNVEIQPVDRAAATFNYLSSERRWVAGAFIPPDYIHMRESEIAAEMAKKKETYMIDEYLL